MNVPQVIAAIPPTDLRRLVRDADQTAITRWVNEARPITAACLDLCLKKLPAANRHFALGIDQPVFFSNHSRAATLTENGTIVVHLIKYNDFTGSSSKSDEKLLEQTMDLLHPNWRQEVVARQYLPAITVAHDYAHVGRTVPQPGPVVPEIRGLYVAGDWAGHNELLADAAAASAKRAADALLQQLTVDIRKDVYHVV
jgi:phytoene dehydrogenase-like protein